MHVNIFLFIPWKPSEHHSTFATSLRLCYEIIKYHYKTWWWFSNSWCLMQEAPCGDFVSHFFCHLCAICQEYREIRERSGNANSPDLRLAVVTAPPTQTMESDSEKQWFCFDTSIGTGILLDFSRFFMSFTGYALPVVSDVSLPHFLEISWMIWIWGCILLVCYWWLSWNY